MGKEIVVIALVVIGDGARKIFVSSLAAGSGQVRIFLT